MILSDVRSACRWLLADRSFTLVAVVALALGIGANNTVFTLVNGILLRDLPFTDASRIVAIDTIRPADADRPFDNMSLPDVRDLQAGVPGLTGIAASDEVTMTIVDGGGLPEAANGAYVTGNAFALLGVRPALGRDFSAADDAPGAEPVAILGHAFWQARLGGDARVLGRSFRVDGTAVTIVGVMPEGFGFPNQSELWVPIGVRKGAAQTSRGARQIDAFGRLADGVTIALATTALDGVMRQLAADHPDTNTGIGPRVRPYRETNTGGPVRVTLATLTSAVALLLLVACANVANLLLARGTARAREFAIRVSLGATRGRIVSQLLTESLILAALGALAGVPISLLAVRGVRNAIRGTGEPYWLAFPFDLRVFAFIIGLTALTTVVFGLLPSLHTIRRSLVDVLGDGGPSVVGRARSRRWMGGLVIAQVALVVTLMTGAGLMIRNLQVELAIDAGVDTADLVSMEIRLPSDAYPDAATRRTFYTQLDDQLAALPGVAAGSGTRAPLGGGFSRAVTIDDGRASANGARPRVSNLMVGRTYFDALGTRALRGRLFNASDGTTGLPVAVVNRRFAERFFGDREALGRRISLAALDDSIPDTGWLTIVGIVPNIRHEESDARVVEAVVYLPHASAPLASGRIVARGAGDAATAVAAVRAGLARVDPALATSNVTRVRDAWVTELRPFQLFGTLFAAFAVAALLLAAVGLYGVSAYSVAVRARELGVRIALGASAAHVVWVVARRTAGQLAWGLALGSIGAALAGLAIQGLLFSIAPYDPVTLATVAVVCIAAAFVACVGPAQRALRTDPATVLRES